MNLKTFDIDKHDDRVSDDNDDDTNEIIPFSMDSPVVRR